MKPAISYYESQGLEIKDVSKEKIGYDLSCDSKALSFGVKVKGTRTLLLRSLSLKVRKGSGGKEGNNSWGM